MKRTSIADIAKKLNVSKTLVSMVLNGHGDKNGISRETQKRVMETAKKLNYQPNLFARGLRLGKSNTLGLIVADISNAFYSKISRGIEDNASKYGYNLMICSSDEKEDKELRLIQMLKERQVDGLIISSTLSKHEAILRLKKENYPFVLIDRYFPQIKTNYVIVDNYKGAFDAVEHLIKLGYDKIAQITISPAHITSLKERTRGYHDALKKYNLRYNKTFNREIPFGNIRDRVYNEIRELIMPPNNVRALFVANNNLAIACMESINEMNLRIPQDIALVSFDDINVFKFCYPPVTSIAQPVDKICEEAVKMLVNEIESSEKLMKKKHVILPTDLVVRRSCGGFLSKL